MNPFRLIVTDLDNTVLCADGSISDKTAEVFARFRAAGIPAALATARFDPRMFAARLNADYSIHTDGTLIQKTDGTLIYKRTFHTDTANCIIGAILEKAPETDIIIPMPGGIARRCRRPFSGEALKIAAEFDSEEAAQKIAADYDCGLIHYRGEKRYSFLPQGAGKVEAIRVLAEHLDIAMTDVIAFGDDLGDMEMLSACGMGVAVENALPEVKAAADAVCGPCREDGVALFLEKNFLQQLNRV